MESISEAGLIKLIRVTLRPGHQKAYLGSQAVWNRESRMAAGYLGEIVGEGEAGELHVMTFWRSRAEYELWMKTDHDRIAALAASDAHYSKLDVQTIDRIIG